MKGESISVYMCMIIVYVIHDLIGQGNDGKSLNDDVLVLVLVFCFMVLACVIMVSVVLVLAVHFFQSHFFFTIK